jgi:hypothetical protein
MELRPERIGGEFCLERIFLEEIGTGPANAWEYGKGSEGCGRFQKIAP